MPILSQIETRAMQRGTQLGILEKRSLSTSFSQAIAFYQRQLNPDFFFISRWAIHPNLLSTKG